MTAMAVAPRSTRPLSEVTKHLIYPADQIATTDWPDVEKTCRRKLGITFDGWQDGAGRLILARDADGELVSTVGGVGMSIPRQVGKTYTFIGLLFSLCIERPGLLVLWTAHRQTTHAETFLQMAGFARRPQVDPYIKKVFLGSGDEEVRFTNGSRIRFGSRERGFGRGIPNVDVIVFDEAQILSEKALQDMLASMNRSRLGLHCYVGTPPKPTDNSEVFSRMRMEALSGETDDLVWIEMGADDDADLDDMEQVAKANASYPHWTPPASIKRLRRKLDPDGFRREALGIWPAENWALFDVAAWVGLEDRSVGVPDHVAISVDVSPYRNGATIGVAGLGPGGRTLVMVYRGSGTSWVAPKVAELMKSVGVVEVSLTAGEARGLAGDIAQEGIEFKKLTAADVGASCTAFQAAVAESMVVHVGQPDLDVAVANARTRRMGDAETWDRDFRVDISPLVAAAAAYHRWNVLAEQPYNVLESVL
jgi:hypothetical protein